MKIIIILVVLILSVGACVQYSPTEEDQNITDNNLDELRDNVGSSYYLGEKVYIERFGHASVMLEKRFGFVKRLYFDPFVLPDNPIMADVILMSHDHFDHCPDDISRIIDDGTRVVGTFKCVEDKSGSTYSLDPFGSVEFADGINITAVHAYNIDRDFHPKGEGIGFIVEIADLRVYFAGDTDFIPEMSGLGEIDIAFLPIGGKYTMNIEEAVAAAREINPGMAIPVHYNSGLYGLDDIDADPTIFKEMLSNTDISVLILKPSV